MLAKLVNSLPNAVSQRLTQAYFQGTEMATRMLNRGRRKLHSYPDCNNYNNMDIKILPALSDNYMYLLIDKATKQAAIVDPVEPQTVMNAVSEEGVNLTAVLTTHHHWDHAGGNAQLKKAMPHLCVFGGDPRIGALTHMVGHNQQLNVGSLIIRCLFTPCHTTGHICYYVESPGDSSERVVFTGDTMFVGGCGRFFEGTAEQMYSALINILSNLPGETKVYCGHEYTLNNLQFASFIEPMNNEVMKKLQWSMQRRQMGLPTVPSTIAEERAYNPFMRVTEPSIMEHSGICDPILAMKQLRQEKDNFQPS